MDVSAAEDRAPRWCVPALSEVNARIGSNYRWRRRLPGGEQGGAHLVVEDDRCAVLTAESAGWRAERLLQAFPAVVHATDGGWPAARWLEVGPLVGGGAFLLQEYVAGTAMSGFDAAEVRTVLAANASQSGLAYGGARDDSAQLDAVLSGRCGWKAQVAGFTPRGARLVRHGDEVVDRAGPALIPSTDVVHGDYSSSNILIDDGGGTATFVDCQAVGRGSRVRDLADLYRQSYVYPSDHGTGLGLLRRAGVDVEGPEVFARCAVAVTYNNLAWWAEHKTPAEFDHACGRLHQLFDDLRNGLAATGRASKR